MSACGSPLSGSARDSYLEGIIGAATEGTIVDELEGEGDNWYMFSGRTGQVFLVSSEEIESRPRRLSGNNRVSGGCDRRTRKSLPD